MMSGAPQVPQLRSATWRMLAAVALVAISTAGCLKRGAAEVTGSIPTPQQATPEVWRRQAEVWGPRFEANPADTNAALNYARALRGLDQKPQAVAVLQQAAIRSPNHAELLAAYGKALSEVGRYKEASEALSHAHSPERPDWRVLSAQGAIADQTGDHAMAQKYYETALKLVPDEPSVLSNLGLSYALSKRLGEAERVLRQAADHPRADARVRRNLALVLSLQGKFDEAEAALQRDLQPEEATSMMADLRSLVSQPNSWNAIRRADGKAARPRAGGAISSPSPGSAPASG
jgi:Flp pilus assembly protein TadD